MRFLFCLFLWVGVRVGHAQYSNFEKITIADGLSQGMVYDILQTRDGFLWIATKDGLNRYDGYNFKVFTNNPFDPYSLAENTVVSLFEDSRGWLWVGTESKGLDLYDPQTGRFHHFNLNAIRHEADDYLIKPFNTEELLIRTENLVENRRQLRQIFAKKYGTLAFEKENSEMRSKDNLTPFLTAPDREFLKKFVQILDENIENERFSIEDFSEKMFLSRSQLHRKIKAMTDQSPTDFVKNYRLDRAHSMLKNREGRVGEIALRVGFASEKYFSTVFKEKFGVSPSQVN